MGLSSKQVSSGDRLDWGQVLMTAGTTLELSKPPPPSMRRQQQHQQQQLEPLKCPRCDSVNTKFCYYNNYNKTQPRHFCKACKRHWTKGGTLRNVPVGGGRKNKRLKTSNTTTSTTTTTTTTATATATVAINNDINRRNNTHLAIHQTHNHHHQNVPIVLADHQKSLSDILYQTFIRSPYSLQHDSINNSRSNSSNNNFNGSKNNGIFLGSSSTTPLLSLPQEPNLQFPFSSSSTSFESNPSSISTSFQPSNVYNYIGKSETTEDSTITHLMPTAAAAATSNSINITHQPWQHVPTTISSSLTDMPASYWNWDDINTFVSTDLNLPWDDFELKP